MQNNVQTRKLPFKSKLIMIILLVIAILVYFLVQSNKVLKANDILNKLGYENISNLKIYSKTKVENKDTKIQGYKYFVKFNNKQNKACKGFIFKDFKKEVKQDITCR